MRFFTVLLLLVLTVPAVAAPLPPGTPLLPEDSAAAFNLNTHEDTSASLSRIPVEGQAFSTALHAQTTKVPQYAYDTQLLTTTTAPVKAGDALLLTLWTRVLKPNDGSAKIVAVVEVNGGDYARSLEHQIVPSGVWKRTDFPFKALKDYPTGGGLVALTLGGVVQTVEVGGIMLTDFGPHVSVDDLPQTHLTYDGRDPNAAWRRDAAARIDKFRKGDLTVKVVDADGKPVKGAQVHVQQTRSAFAWGTALRSDFLLGTDADRYQTEAARLFNLAAPENELKWPW